MSDDPQPIGLPAARRRDLFPCPTSASSTDRPPTLASRIHALVPFLPFGVSSSILPPTPFGVGRPAGGSVPLRDITEGVHSCRSVPGSCYVPPTGFLSLSTACSTFGYTGLFHPAATSRVTAPSRGFSRPAAVPAHHRALPPCRCRSPAHRQAGCHARSPRLRGLALRIDAFLEAGFSRPFGRSPLRVLASSRFPRRHREPGSPGRPLVTFPSESSRHPRASRWPRQPSSAFSR
jgi:hypothetical protein